MASVGERPKTPSDCGQDNQLFFSFVGLFVDWFACFLFGFWCSFGGVSLLVRWLAGFRVSFILWLISLPWR